METAKLQQSSKQLAGSEIAHAAAPAMRQRTPLNPKPPEYYEFVHVHLLLLILLLELLLHQNTYYG
jgi:hypothetical protein